MKRIGWDIDEVLAAFIPSLMRFHNERYGTNFSKKDVHSYRFEDVWGGTQQDADHKLQEFHTTDHYLQIEPIQGAQSIVSALKKQYEMHVITSRQHSTLKDTLHWLDRHFPHLFTELHFSSSVYHGRNSRKQSKADICKELGVEFMVEDSLPYAAQRAAQGIPVFLVDFEYPWNQGKEPAGVKRIKSWDQLVANIK